MTLIDAMGHHWGCNDLVCECGTDWGAHQEQQQRCPNEPASQKVDPFMVEFLDFHGATRRGIAEALKISLSTVNRIIWDGREPVKCGRPKKEAA